MASLALLDSAVAAAPAHAQKPALDCRDSQGTCSEGTWYYL
ncbi:hypothetical protein [Catellatospora sp. TT07R-123]|nr:hypothetical protein [Catellatospora sp. TT07R-123]